MKKSTGIGLFCYNRPSHLKRVLIALESLKINNIVIFIDGPKNEIDKINQEYINFTINTSKIRDIETIKRKKNLGLKKSIELGLDYLSIKFEKFIVIEDDCVPYKFFFKFLNYNLDKYKNDNDINNICTYQFNAISKKFHNELFTISLNHFIPWGWATWSHKWLNYRNTRSRATNNLPDYFFDLIKNKNKNYKKNIWSIEYIIYQYASCTKSIYPTISLVKNIGFDGSGINSKASSFFISKEVKIKKNRHNVLLEDNKIINLQNRILKNKIGLFY